MIIAQLNRQRLTSFKPAKVGVYSGTIGDYEWSAKRDSGLSDAGDQYSLYHIVITVQRHLFYSKRTLILNGKREYVEQTVNHIIRNYGKGYQIIGLNE